MKSLFSKSSIQLHINSIMEQLIFLSENDVVVM